MVRPATGGDDGPEPREEPATPDTAAEGGGERDHERWLHEQRPPHWG
ncbi:hypothetical protein [Calidifontibacter indicus]|nr:hypothetical protein [Calidifontibacter indicus]